MNNSITLREFRLHHPHTAEVPTITQSGVLGLLLETQRRKAARQAFCLARRERIFNILRTALAKPWLVLTNRRV